MKRNLFIFLVFVMIFTNSLVGFSKGLDLKYDGKIHNYTGKICTLKVNNELISFDIPPIIFDGRSLVPVRAIFEKLDAEVLWDDKNKKVNISHRGSDVELIINDKFALINGKKVEMEVPAKIINDRTMVPVRFVGEQLNMKVGWINDKNEITIDSYNSLELGSLNNILYTKKEDIHEISIALDKYSNYKVMRLYGEDKIVVDFPNTKVLSKQKHIDINNDIIKAVRCGQFDTETARVVLDLSGQPQYQLVEEKSKLILNLRKATENINNIKNEYEDENEEKILAFLTSSSSSTPTSTSELAVKHFKRTDHEEIYIKADNCTEYKDFILNDPDYPYQRIVIDIPNATVLGKQQIMELNTNIVKSVRYAQNDKEVARIVVDVKTEPNYKIIKQNGYFVLHIWNKGEQIAIRDDITIASRGSEEKDNASFVNNKLDVKYQVEKGIEQVVMILNDYKNYKITKQVDYNRIFIDLPNAIGPEKEQKADIKAELIESLSYKHGDENSSRIIIELNSQAQYEVREMEGKLVLLFTKGSKGWVSSDKGPVKGDSSKEEPVTDKDVKEEPANDKEVKEEPAKGEVEKDETAKDEVEKEGTTNERPSESDLEKEQIPEESSGESTEKGDTSEDEPPTEDTSKENSSDIEKDDSDEDTQNDDPDENTKNDDTENVDDIDLNTLKIEYEKNSSFDKVVLNIEGDKHNISRISDPDRIVIDIPNTIIEEKQGRIDVKGTQIDSIRYSQDVNNSVRVVIDLIRDSQFQTAIEDEKLTITLTNPTYKNIEYHNTGDRIHFILTGVKLTEGGESIKNLFSEKFDLDGRQYTITFPSELGDLGSGVMNINDTVVDEVKINKNEEMNETSVTFTTKEAYNYHVITRDYVGNTAITILKRYSKSDKLVVIDAGHGGEEPGAVSGSIHEKDLNIDIAMRLNELLKKRNIKTYMIRENDSYIGLYERAYIANSLNATLFLSIHNNAYYSSHKGTETLYYPQDSNDTSFNGKRFAQIIQDSLVGKLNTNYRKIIERPNLVVLKATKMDSALAEIAFMTNKEDLARLKTESFRQKAAEALCEAIIQALSEVE